MNKFSSPADKQKGFSSASSNPHKLTNSNDGTADTTKVIRNREEFCDYMFQDQHDYISMGMLLESMLKEKDILTFNDIVLQSGIYDDENVEVQLEEQKFIVIQERYRRGNTWILPYDETRIDATDDIVYQALAQNNAEDLDLTENNTSWAIIDGLQKIKTKEDL